MALLLQVFRHCQIQNRGLNQLIEKTEKTTSYVPWVIKEEKTRENKIVNRLSVRLGTGGEAKGHLCG
jgi:hypothetical protein